MLAQAKNNDVQSFMSKILKGINIPTWITLARLALLPFILFFYVMAVCGEEGSFWIDYGKLVAVILFIIAALTDFLDGYLARKWNQVTNTGKLLDPVADKMLTTLGFILILADPIFGGNVNHSNGIQAGVEAGQYWIFVIAIFVILGRDIIMNSLRFIAAEQGIAIAADRLGKFKTLCQFFAIVMYMILAWNLTTDYPFMYMGVWLDMFCYVAIGFLAFATLFSVWSCANYIRNYVKGVISKGVKNDGQK